MAQEDKQQKKRLKEAQKTYNKFFTLHGAIMVFPNGTSHICTRVAEQLSPAFGIPILSPEHGNKIMVAELTRITVGPVMMIIYSVAGLVHIPRILFPVVCRYRIYSPVKIYPKYGILAPPRGSTMS